VRDVVPEQYSLYDPSFDEYADMNYNNWLDTKQGTGEVFIARLEFLVLQLQKLLRKSIRAGCTVKEVHAGHVVVQKGEKEVIVPFSSCVVATSRKEAEEIVFKEVPVRTRVRLALSVSKTCSSQRTYTYSKQPHGIAYDYLVSNRPYRFAIKIDDHVLMATYTDEKRADEAMKKSPRRLQKELQKQLGIPIDDLIQFPWKDAYTITHYNANSKLLAGIHRLSPTTYQTFVPNALEQAWIETHLLQAARVVRELLQKN
jgi:hypothetical protein